eukprot:1120362-Rhodomonas_salina.3
MHTYTTTRVVLVRKGWELQVEFDAHVTVPRTPLLQSPLVTPGTGYELVTPRHLNLSRNSSARFLSAMIAQGSVAYHVMSRLWHYPYPGLGAPF